MNKLLLPVLALSVFVPTIAFAQSDEEVTKRRPDRPAQAEIQEIRQERQENRQERRSEVSEKHANRLERRFKFYFDRLSKVIARFQSRLDILKAAGKDTIATQAILDSAKTKLQEGKTQGDAAILAFRAIDPAKFSEQKTEAFAARDLANSARKLFLETHKLIKDALKSLKNIVKPALPAAEEAL